MASDRPDPNSGTAEAERSTSYRESTQALISKAIMRLVSEYTGRGPMKARTTINGSLVVCLLEDTLTKGERMLVASGRREAVLQMRASYQEAMSREAIAAVEELTGRRVLAFMSTNHADPDYAAEIFVLDGEGYARAESEPGVRG